MKFYVCDRQDPRHILLEQYADDINVVLERISRSVDYNGCPVMSVRDYQDYRKSYKPEPVEQVRF